MILKAKSMNNEWSLLVINESWATRSYFLRRQYFIDEVLYSRKHFQNAFPRTQR